MKLIATEKIGILGRGNRKCKGPWPMWLILSEGRKGREA